MCMLLSVLMLLQNQRQQQGSQGPTYLPSLSRMAQKASPLVPSSPSNPSKLMPLSLPSLTLSSPSQLDNTLPPCGPNKPLRSSGVQRSPSPPHPLIAAPLLEMGFSLKHVQKAINAVGSESDVISSLAKVNVLSYLRPHCN